jgi:hypothetical protein
MLKNPGTGSELKVFIDNASYPKWPKSRSWDEARKRAKWVDVRLQVKGTKLKHYNGY